MEQKPIIPYSRIVGDDGAFKKAQEDLDNFLAHILKQADKIKGVLGNIDIKDTNGLAKTAKDIEELKKMQAEYEEALKSLNTAQKQYNKLKKDARKVEIESTKELDDAYVKLEQYKYALKATNMLEKEGTTTVEDSAKARGRLRLMTKALTDEIRKQEKEILQGNTLTAKEIKLQKAKEVVMDKQVDTLEKVRERMSALRLVVQNTNLETEEGRELIEKYNREIDELTDLLSKNSDKFIQNKINIGNYTESIKEAIKGTDLFKTDIKLLDSAFEKLIEVLFASKEATEANTVAQENNSKSLGVLAKINGFLAGIFKKNTTVVAGNTETIVANTVAVDAETEAIVANSTATTANTATTNANTSATARNTGAVGKLIKSFKGLNIALKGTIILGVIALLGSLFAVFKQGRAGVVATEKAMARFQVIAKVTITTLADFGKGLFSLFGAIGSSFSNLALKFEKFALNMELLFKKPTAFSKEAKAEVASLEAQIASLDKQIEENAKKNGDTYAQAWDKMGTAVSSFSKRIEDGMKTIKTVDEGIIRAFEIGDQIKKTELQIINLQKAVRGLEMMGDDDTLSLNTQLQATNLLLEARLKLLRKESEINGLNLEMANAKARADLEANATSIGARADAIAGIKNEAKFTEALLQLNIDLSERKGENPLDDEALNASIEALKVYKQGLVEIEIAKQENAEKLRKIDRDIYEQNLDLLIDLIDKEKQLSEQQVNSTVLNYEKRLEEFDRFRTKFKDNAQKELEEFNKLAVNSAKSLRSQLTGGGLSADQTKLIREELEKLDKLDLNIKFDANGDFKVMNGEIELSIDEIQKLNDELQSLGLAEIPVNRFREFVQETQAWLKDTREQEIALKKVGIAIQELQANNSLSSEQLAELRQLKSEIADLANPNDLDPLKGGYDKQLKLIEKYEKRKTEMIEQNERDRLYNRLHILDEEEALLKAQAERLYLIQKQKTDKNATLTEEEKKKAYENSEDLLKITEERLNIETQLESGAIDKSLEKQKEQTEKLKAEWERFKADLFKVFDLIADKFVEMANKQVQSAETAITKQEKAVDEQRARAQAGLANTLAFEQEQLAKREAQAERARKKAERLEKIKALWTSYQSYASDPNNKDGEAITKTLRDFAILEAIQASFGDGGLVADKVPTDANGIIRGRSHKGNGGGIPVMVERGEGFFSSKEVDNLGVDNFRAFKGMLGKGRVTANLFKKQRQDFIKMMPVAVDNSKIEQGLEDVRREIRDKPTNSVDVEGLVNGFLQITKTEKTPNRTKKTRYIVKRKRF